MCRKFNSERNFLGEFNMKKSILILAAVAAIAFTGCGTTKKVAGS